MRNRAVGIAVASFVLALGVASTPAGPLPVLNGKVAFVRGGDVYVVNPDGANKLNLTDSQGSFEQQARFSPDGRTIAFLSTPLDGTIFTGDDDVWVMNADGSNPRRVTNIGRQIASLEWTADGTRLLYFAERDNNEEASELYSIKPDGTGQAMLTAAGPRLDGPTWLSTAADKIVFAGVVGNNSDVYVINTDGSGLLRLTNDPGFDARPVIAPNAARIAWQTDRDHRFNGEEIYAINADGTGQQRLTSGAGVANAPAGFSPDGTQLGFEREGQAGLMGADGSNAHTLGLYDHFYYFDQWSPDGRRIAISNVLPLRGEDPRHTIVTVTPQATQKIELTDRDDDAVFSDWQAVTSLPPDPPLTLDASARAKQKAKPAKATVECSNECELEIKAKGRAGGVRFASKLSPDLYGGEETPVTLLRRKVARAIEGERGTLEAQITATDDFANTETATVELRLKR